MYEKLSACPLCDHNSFTNHLVIEDHAITGEGFALVKCSNCQLIFTNPRPVQEAMTPYYSSDDYISHSGNWTSPLQLVYGWARRYMLGQKLSWLKQLRPGEKSLLDVGCGVGSFLAFAQARGWKVCGVEPHQKARTLSQQKNLQVYSNLEEIPKTKFAVITLWHVLEHLHDLKGTIKSLYRLLSPKGHIIIAVPNHKSYDADLYQQFWAGYDVPRHLYHFDPSNIKFLAQRFKLKIIRTIPLKLDAYYVSILSEKYQNGSIFRGLLNGLKSNRWAKQNQSHYSSLVYILRK